MSPNYQPKIDFGYIIDDSELTCLVHSKILEETHLTDAIRTFTNPVKALKYLVRDIAAGLQIILLLDIEMPHCTGLDFLDVLTGLKTEPGQVTVHMVSSSITKYNENNILKHPMIASHLKKPLKIEDLEQYHITRRISFGTR